MSVEIKNVENLVLNSINFDWKFNISDNSSWHVSSNDFLLKDISSTCSLSMQYNTLLHYQGLESYSSIRMTITFANYQVMLGSINLIMIHEATGKAFSFYFKKEDGNPNTFSANKNIHLEPLFRSTNQDWKIRIVYEHNETYRNELLESDFKELLKSEKHADFSIKTQNVVFKVHKGILSCRCNVLAKAIETDMVEKQKSEMQLDLWDPPVIKEFLSFIYTGSCELSLNPHQLFQLTHYFQLDELKIKCIKYLEDNINSKNIVHTLELTDEEQYNLRDLQILAHSFVKKNESSLVKDINFQEYLSKSIKINNLVFSLHLAYTYNLNGPLECAKEFIKQNHKEVLENDECRKYLLSQAELLLDILKFTLNSTLKAS